MSKPDVFTAMAALCAVGELSQRADATGGFVTKPTDEYYTTCKIHVETAQTCVCKCMSFAIPVDLHSHWAVLKQAITGRLPRRERSNAVM